MMTVEYSLPYMTVLVLVLVCNYNTPPSGRNAEPVSSETSARRTNNSGGDFGKMSSRSFHIDVSLGVGTLPVVEKSAYETRPRGCAIHRHIG